MLLKKNIIKNNFWHRIKFSKYKNSFITFDILNWKDDNSIRLFEWKTGFYFALIHYYDISIYNQIMIF